MLNYSSKEKLLDFINLVKSKDFLFLFHFHWNFSFNLSIFGILLILNLNVSETREMLVLILTLNFLSFFFVRTNIMCTSMNTFILMASMQYVTSMTFMLKFVDNYVMDILYLYKTFHMKLVISKIASFSACVSDIAC